MELFYSIPSLDEATLWIIAGIALAVIVVAAALDRNKKPRATAQASATPTQSEWKRLTSFFTRALSGFGSWLTRVSNFVPRRKAKVQVTNTGVTPQQPLAAVGNPPANIDDYLAWVEVHGPAALNASGSGKPPIPPEQSAATSPNGDDPEDKAQDPRLRPWLYWLLVITAYAIWTILFLGSVLLWIGGEPISVFGDNLKLGAGAAILLIAYFISTLRQTDTDMVSGITLFGLPLIVSGPGLVPVITGLMRRRVLPRGVVQAQFPAEPELVYKGPDIDKLPEVVLPNGDVRTMVRPIRLNTRTPTQTELTELGLEADDPLASATVLMVQYFVRFRIKNFFEFLIRIGTTDEAVRQLRDTGEAWLGTELVQWSTAGALLKIGDINARLKAKLEDLTSEWGVEIDDATMFTPDISRDLAEAIRLIAVAKAQKAIKIRTAEGESRRLELEGKGSAEATRLLLEAQAAGYERIQKVTGVPGEKVLASQVAGRLADNANTIVLGADGFRDAMGVVSVVADQLRGPNNPPQGGKRDRRGPGQGPGGTTPPAPTPASTTAPASPP